MRTRLDFDAYIKEVMGDSVHVYYQPPSNVTGVGTVVRKNMSYPALLYSVNDYNISSADNTNYKVQKEYSVTLVTKDPDDGLADKIAEIPTARHNREYISDGLYHSVFIIIY